jgi:hypothetical protein
MNTKESYKLNSLNTFTKNICAPYVDTTAWPPFDLVKCFKECGQKYFTLAFIVSQNNSPSWGGYYPLATTSPPWFLDQIENLRSLGGDVIISCGGATGQELAQTITDINLLVSAYQSIIDIYKLQILDFDIEGGAVADSVSVDRRNKALVMLRKNNPHLKIHYTLPVMPDGLVSSGVNILKNAFSNGLKIDLVNLMCMDYSSEKIDMGQAAISAGRSTHNQLTQIGYLDTKVGICPMIGLNDTYQVFTLEDAQKVVDFARSNSYIGLVSFWSANRDIEQKTPSTYVSPSASGIVQSKNQFAMIFNQFSGM